MANYTALQLVNRVRRRMHMSDAADLTDRLSLVLLDLVNESMSYILETRSWDFDGRSDGVLVTKAAVTNATTTVTNGSATALGYTPCSTASVSTATTNVSAAFKTVKTGVILGSRQ